MNTPLTDALSAICREFPLQEKVLITPDYRLGREVLQSLSKSGTPWVNFRMATAASLANEVAESAITMKGLKRVSGPGIIAVIEDIFHQLADSGELEYFEKHETNSGIVQALTGVVMELRTKGIRPVDIKGKYLTKSEKANDLKIILSGYEKRLEDKGLIDRAGLTMLAMRNLADFPKMIGRKYVIFARYYMSGLERQFIEKLTGDDLIVVCDGPVFNVRAPKGLWGSGCPGSESGPGTDAGRSAWMYCPEKAPEALNDGTLDIFEAKGFREEIREIFRRIVSGGTALDEVEIIYTDAADYRREIMVFCEKLGVDATFSEGVPASMTTPFRAVTGFLEWVKNDFLEIHLRRVLGSGDIEVPGRRTGAGDDGAVLGYLLRVSGVGWSRARYEKVLKRKEEEYTLKIESLSDPGEIAAFRDRIAQIRLLRGISASLLSFTPEPDAEGKVFLKDMCSAASEFILKYASKRSAHDEAFAEEAVKRTDIISSLGLEKMSVSDAADKLMGTFSTINVGLSDPRPGCIHVSGYKHGGRSGRSNTFIVGLDEIRFPGRRSEDPVLLDMERERIDPDLEVSSDSIQKNIYDMVSVMSGLKGKVTASFSSYNVAEDRAVFPSSIMLQLYRLKTSSPAADYDSLFRYLADTSVSAKSSSGEFALDATEWWVRNLSGEGLLKDASSSVKNIYPWLEAGIRARVDRESVDLTEYDGNIGRQNGELDPRGEKGKVLSCSRLETAAACPYKYFLSSVLGLEKPEETGKDVTSWLDPMQKGSLLHEVFELFTIEIRKKNKDLTDTEQESLIENILTDVAAKFRDSVPPPNEMVYLSEFAVMRRDIKVFLSINKELGTNAVHEELEFGTGDVEPVSIELDDGKRILLRGIIDRVDKAGDHEYHVWDYKTGSAYKYERRQYLAGGEQLQHALYAKAAEMILKSAGEDDRPRVTRAGYLLASEKGSEAGKGNIFFRDPSRKREWRRALCLLLDIISSGGFIPIYTDKCVFCDYDIICSGKGAKERSKIKQSADNAVTGLWRALKDYE